jgi:hypothetical protein
MGNFFNNEPTILRLIVRVRIYHTLIYNYCTSRQKNWIFKNFFLEIYRSQTNYTMNGMMTSLRIRKLFQNMHLNVPGDQILNLQNT